jgi:hypothetical protein
MNKVRLTDDSYDKLDGDFFSRYRFKIFDYFDRDELNAYGGVKSADGGCLISDEDGSIGPNEFYK